jgi:5'-nucleotidase
MIASIGLLAGLVTVGPARAGSAHSHASQSLEDAAHYEATEGARAREVAGRRVGWRDEGRGSDPVVRIKLLGINDFHGQLATGRLVANRPVGGAAILATYLKRASSGAQGTAFIIHAGDHVGATPPDSALLQDEPSVDVLNLLANDQCTYFDVARGMPSWSRAWSHPRCNVIGTLGNHEFDEGVAELLRLIDGGNHATGPFLQDPWRGARYPYVSANVVDAATGAPILPPYSIKVADGVRFGVIGAVLRETPTIVTPSGVAGVRFLDEADAINGAVAELRAQNIEAIVVTIHQGLRQAPSFDSATPDAPPSLTGPIVEIVRRLDDAVDVVISGHAHGFSNAIVPNSNGTRILLTQAFSSGTAYADIDVAISRLTGEVVEKSARVLTTWSDDPAVVPDVEVGKVVAAAGERVAPLVSRVIGVAAVGIDRATTPAGESRLGNLIANAQRLQTAARFAFMNPGGIRTDIDAGETTWGELFNVQPFGNDLVSMDLTGVQLETLLEQQWINQPAGGRILQISGLHYTWNAAAAIGDRIDPSLIIDEQTGQPVEPAATYRVTVNSFLATGGDNFVVLNSGLNRVVGQVDLEALIEHIAALQQPFTAPPLGRITRQN